MFCNRCGREVPDDSDFCPLCGADLRAVRRAVSAAGTTGPGVTPLPGSDPGILGAETVIGPRAIAEIAVGMVLAGRYEVRELLGSGGMGAVYRVYDRELAEEVALKVLHPEMLASGTAVERFVREVQVSRRLTHRGIVRVHDIGRAGELRYLTMELLKGRNLRARLEEVKGKGERLPLPEVKEILGAVLSALSYAHRVTVHRDVKPENVFLEEQPGGGFRVKLLDFGIAKVLDRETFTRTSTSLGTAWYVAPEQMGGGGKVDGRADLYSVGVLAYELLTGELPVGRFRRPSEVREDLGGAWDEWVFRAMERDPGSRYGSAEEMLGALPGGGEPTSSVFEVLDSPGGARGLGGAAGSSAVRADAVENPRPGERRVWTIAGEEFAFRWIPPGEDVLGSPEDEPGRSDDERQWTAVITRGFWMGETPVTRQQWIAVMERLPGLLSGWLQRGCPNCPVVNVSWEDAQRFVLQLNRLAPESGFRLPREAEWEYACRAGSDGPFNLPCRDYGPGRVGRNVPCLDEIGWYRGNSDGRVQPVGRLRPNAWGLHDCHGNVWEWCEDRYGTYPTGRREDWTGSEQGPLRVLRGGSWATGARYLRSAVRGRYVAGHRCAYYGFRIVRTSLSADPGGPGDAGAVS